MVISHPKIPEIRDDWLLDENEVIDILLPQSGKKYRCAIVDKRQVVILCCSNESST